MYEYAHNFLFMEGFIMLQVGRGLAPAGKNLLLLFMRREQAPALQAHRLILL